MGDGCGVRGMSSRLVASMIAASVMFGANGTLREIFGADSRQVMINKTWLEPSSDGT